MAKNTWRTALNIAAEIAKASFSIARSMDRLVV